MNKIICLAFTTMACMHCRYKNEIKLHQTLYVPAVSKDSLSNLQVARFAFGCFWCIEPIFENLKGVKEVISGYSGGDTPNPNYEEVGSGLTGHAESIEIYYDSSILTFPDLLRVYFASGDPTQVNGQGPDRGSQYRSIIFYNNEVEKKLAEDYIKKVNESKMYEDPVVTQVKPYFKFWDAEDYHQNFVAHNPNNPYVKYESMNRIQKAFSKIKDLLKPDK